MDVQIKKGLIELCMLAALREKDSYGYQMIRDISGYMEISESTLYPILRRLEADGRVTCYSVEHNGRLRKYFHITEAGILQLREFALERGQLERALDFITGENKSSLSADTDLKADGILGNGDLEEESI